MAAFLLSPPKPFLPLPSRRLPPPSAPPAPPRLLRIRCSSPSSSPPPPPPPLPTLPIIPKLVRFRALDRVAARASRVRFARKLLTLLLSKPRYFLPLSVLRHCRRYLAIPPRRSLLPFILRYPSLFSLSFCYTSQTLIVSLTPAALALADSEARLAARHAPRLATSLHRLLMLAPSRRLLIPKISHIAADLGLPPDFRVSVCQRHPDRFSVRGPFLTLSTWDPALAVPLPPPPPPTLSATSGRIIDRTEPRFPHLALRRGLNLRRCHRDYLLHLNSLPNVSPYADNSFRDSNTPGAAEKRACAAVREVLALTVHKRTLVDHLTHFRKDFGLPNQLRALLVRHPEMFYVSINGVRDSVFLLEAYDENGRLRVPDELTAGRAGLESLVSKSKGMRRARRKANNELDISDGFDYDDNEEVVEEMGDFENLFEDGESWADISSDNGDENRETEEADRFWLRKAVAEGLIAGVQDGHQLEVW